MAEKKQVSDNLIATLASNAVLATKGVARLSQPAAINLRERDPGVKGVRLIRKGRSVIIDLYLDVAYGAKIPEVAWQVQENVKTAVSVTEAEIVKININVQGVSFPEDWE